MVLRLGWRRGPWLVRLDRRQFLGIQIVGAAICAGCGTTVRHRLPMHSGHRPGGGGWGRVRLDVGASAAASLGKSRARNRKRERSYEHK